MDEPSLSPSFDLDYRAYRLATLLSELLEVGSLQSFSAHLNSSTSTDPELRATNSVILSDNPC